MSLWGKLAGVGLAAFGAATGNPAALAAGASIFTGDLAASAAKDAAKTQEQASDKALALGERVYNDTSTLQRDVYNQSRADLAPYMSLGSGVMGNLGGMVGVTPSSAPSALVSSSPTGTPAGAPISQVAGMGAAGGLTSNSGAYGPGGTLSQLATPMVTLQAPDGTVRAVPAAMASSYEAKGARRVPQGEGVQRAGLV